MKTTDFGAFVELKKGTDGLLHVSNVGPGRVAHIQDVMDRGDVVDVLVQEVDKDRGRIGLKLVAKHENGGLVMPEELIERAKDAPPREPREERPRGDRSPVATAAARASGPSDTNQGRTSGSDPVLPSARSDAALAELFDVTGSGVGLITWAVFVIQPPPFPVTVVPIEIVTCGGDPPLASDPNRTRDDARGGVVRAVARDGAVATREGRVSETTTF